MTMIGREENKKSKKKYLKKDLEDRRIRRTRFYFAITPAITKKVVQVLERHQWNTVDTDVSTLNILF